MSISPLAGLGRDVFWSYVSVAATMVASLAIPAFVIRSAGASAYGVYAVVMAAAALIGPLDIALSLAVSRAAARHQTADGDAAQLAERDYLNASHLLYTHIAKAVGVLTAAAAVAVALGVTPRGGVPERDLVFLVLLVGAGVGLTAGTAAFHGVVIGSRRFRTSAMASAAGAVVTCVLLAALINPAGLVGLGVAVFAGTLVNRVIVVMSARRLAPWLVGVRRSARRDPAYAAHRRAVLSFALPLVIVGVGAQVVATTDVFVLGAFVSAATVGVFRAASLLPTQAIGLVYRGYDACFPALASSTNPREQERATNAITRVAALGCGALFGTMAILADDVLRVLTGTSSDLGVEVLRVFAAVWCVNAAVHGLALSLIARGLQRTFAPLVAVEAIANLVLTIVLVGSVGPAGAAWATLVTLTVSNLVLLPVLTRHNLHAPFATIFRDGVAFVVAGFAIAALTLTALAPLTLSGALALTASAAAVSLFAGPAAVAVWRWSARSLTPIDVRHYAVPVQVSP